MIALDLRGHGDSDWAPDVRYSLEIFAADLVAVCRQLDGSHELPPILVGASAGGIASMLAAAQSRDGARALVLVDVAPRLEFAGVARVLEFMSAHADGFERLEDVHEAVSAHNPGRVRPFDPEALQRTVRRHDGRWYWHWDPAVVASFDGERGGDLGYGRMSSAARAVSVPTLLVRGHDSDVLSESGAGELLELIPHARFADVSAGHMVAGDDTDAFTRVVEEFLAGLPGTATTRDAYPS